ncbi:uncharacterized protein I206_106693 [Kwoniella pini CBS 10737]|uniref:Uncharacterized protein n=1 Tax=Kwoniella pini CBS 10737 TaxID=1296096 RepID=A0A1B9HTG5_9TREE|nr:uncharacterized protein I206_07418 [Kwoniella pini CBS 10737]OCF46565.1 hypothetical protein I206_07418 [Kwoniella pini CBS 10737]
MKFFVPTLLSLTLLTSICAAPVPEPNPGLLTGLLSPPTSNPDKGASGGLLESNTGTTLSSILKPLNVNLPEGLVTTLDGVKLSGLNEPQLSSFLYYVLSVPDVIIPNNTTVQELVDRVVGDVFGHVV